MNLSPCGRSAHRRDRGVRGQVRQQTGRFKDNSLRDTQVISWGGLCQGDRRSIIHVTVDLGIWEVSSPRLLVARVLLSRVPRSLGADDYGAHPPLPIVFLLLPCFPAPEEVVMRSYPR